MNDAIGRVGKEESPVEAEDNDEEEDGDHHLVHRLNGGYTSTDREHGKQHGQPMAQHRPTAVLYIHVQVCREERCPCAEINRYEVCVEM